LIQESNGIQSLVNLLTDVIQHRHKIKIYYKDIDQMGIVYYSRYFEFFEVARTELLKSIGLDVTEIEKEGYFLPVISAHCNYRQGARFEEIIMIISSIKKLPHPTLRIDYEIQDFTTQKILVTGYTDHAFINQNDKPVRPPKNVISKLKKHLTRSGEE
jgi:acyl-CoA thioester hydrolase